MKRLIAPLILCAASAAQAAPDLTATEAFEAVQNGKLTLIDIRTPQEWRQTGVAKGAHRVDMLNPGGAEGFARQLLGEIKGDRTAPIALICRTGNRTTQVQRYLQSVGFTQVHNIREGMAGSSYGPGWIKRGLPVESCGQC